MKNFHRSVIGYSHVLKNIPCEDASLSWESEDGQFQIAVISDGHGDPNCFRSSRGSMFAVQAAFEKLKEFGEMLAEQEDIDAYLDDDRDKRKTLRRLTDSILDSWLTKVEQDFSHHEIIEEELAVITKDIDILTKDIPHIYGATLIAVLKTGKYIFGIHQGDGRCIAVSEDGTLFQPIPWDPACHGNIATSLCLPDAANQIRSIIIDTDKTPIAAIAVMSDGVEDSYSDTYDDLNESHSVMAGTYTFVKDFLIRLCEDESFAENCEEYLKDFSQNGQFDTTVGSTDDVSIAGLYDQTAIEQLIPRFKKEIQVYEIDDALMYYQGLLNKKNRMHSLLKEDFEKAKASVDELNFKKEKSQIQMNAVLDELDQLNEKLRMAEDDLNSLDTRETEFDDRLDLFFEALSEPSAFKTAILNAFKNESQKFKDGLLHIRQKIRKKKAEVDTLRKEIDAYSEIETDLLNQMESAKVKFEKNDSTYQAIQKEIADLQGNKEEILNAGNDSTDIAADSEFE